MRIIGCDYHPSWQQVCWMETTTGETGEQKLEHGSGEAERFYRQLAGYALIGMESTGNCQWFVEMATRLGHDVWVGDAAKIRACDSRQQKHDRRDAALLLKLLLEGRFPRIWVPSGKEKDLRQLLIHRYKLVRLRAQVKNELQHLAMNQGITKKRKLWSQAGEKVLRELPLRPWGSRRREDLFRIREMLDAQIAPLDQAVVEAAEKNERARLLMTQPGVGPITSMVFVLTMGDVNRFQRGKQVASYLGLIPREYSSGGHQRFGSISKQGNRFLRMLLVEAAQVAVRCDPQMRNEYLHRCHRKAKGVAKVAAARKLAIRLYWMLRTNKDYPEVVRVESSELGRPWGLAIGPDGLLYMVDGGDLKPGPPDRGRILKLDLNGKILAKWSRFGNYDGQIDWGHDIAVGKDGAVYVGDVNHSMRVQKFVPR